MADLFSAKAKGWDVNERILALSSGIGSALINNVVLTAQMNVLDFGAGTGLLTSQVAARVNKVTAVDISQSMLDQLNSKVELTGKVEPLCRDIIDQPLATKFDLIVSAMAMHHVEDTDKLLQRFAEHLKSGAGIALADLDKEDGTFHPENIEGVYHNGFVREDFQSKLEQHGFKDIQFVTAHTVIKEDKAYPVFLATATKG